MPDSTNKNVILYKWYINDAIPLQYLRNCCLQFALLETFTTAIYDTIPSSRNYKVLITFAASSSCFLLGLPCVSQVRPFEMTRSTCAVRIFNIYMLFFFCSYAFNES